MASRVSQSENADLYHGLLVDDGEGHWRKWPNIFDREPFGSRVLIGHLNLPRRDKRQIPLQMSVYGTSNSAEAVDSFGAQIVHAHEERTNIQPRTTADLRITRAKQRGDFVYGGFISPDKFPRVSARALLDGDAAAKEACRRPVVIVGGTWHTGGSGIGEPVESFASPIGDVPGLYLHANYVEALLDGRYGSGAPVWLRLLLDLLIGISLYFSFHALERPAGRVALLILAPVPLLAAYVMAANLGLYLDFVLPAALFFLHLVYEHYSDLRSAAAKGRTSAPPSVPDPKASAAGADLSQTPPSPTGDAI